MSRLIVTNFISRPTRPRPEVLEGRRFLAVPVTLIVPGILNGSRGPLYYPASEVQKSARLWDNVPVTLGHPTWDGVNVSALTEGVQVMGFIRRPLFTDRLKAEAWLDIERTRKLAPALLADIEAGRSVEVSTGLFTDDLPSSGRWKGEVYKAIARNYKPDHLAILLHEPGACSVADGCGLNVNVCKCRKCSIQSKGAHTMRGTMNAGDVDLMAVAKALGIDANPSRDPVGWVTELRTALESALAQLTGEDDTAEGDQVPATAIGNSELPSYLRGGFGQEFDKGDTIPDVSDYYEEPTAEQRHRERKKATARRDG